MPWSLLWSKPALYAYAAILLSLGAWWIHHHIWQQGYDQRVSEEAAAKVEFDNKVRKAGDEAVTGVLKNEANDVDAVTRATTDILRLCSGSVRSPAGTVVSAPADAKAQDNREITSQDIADDIRACSKALNQCSGLIAERQSITTH